MPKATKGPHQLEYLGWFDTSFERLRSGMRTAKLKGGEMFAFPKPPPGLTGILVGLMQNAGRAKFTVVRVRYNGTDVILGTPISLDSSRHSDGKSLGPQTVTFGDESARRLLEDLIEWNPQASGDLNSIAAALGWQSPASRASASMGTSAAVFARNHLQYLQYATRIGSRNAEQPITFRSSKRWLTASKLLEEHGELPIYFGVVGDESQIQFQARLREVLLDPRKADPVAKRLRRAAPPDTEDDGRVGTLYAISSCRKLTEPFAVSSLVKLSDGKAIADTFKYSYAVVRVHEPASRREPTALDLAEPPARAQASVTRVIRNTAIVRRLKHLHKDRCQRCRKRLKLGDGTAYSEGHHLKPLGTPHSGPDIGANIVIVCPNCHALLDLCAVPIKAKSLHLRAGHVLGEAYLEYHNAMFDGAS